MYKRQFPTGTYCVGKYNTVNSCGAGLLDADAAVNAALNPSRNAGGGGGGGAWDWLDLASLLVLALAAVLLQRRGAQALH